VRGIRTCASTNAVQEIEEFGAPHEFDSFEPESEPLRRAE
jgi:hypothetical protein